MTKISLQLLFLLSHSQFLTWKLFILLFMLKCSFRCSQLHKREAREERKKRFLIWPLSNVFLELHMIIQLKFCNGSWHFYPRQTNIFFGREPWSTSYGMRLMFQRLWVQIPAPYTERTVFHSVKIVFFI